MAHKIDTEKFETLVNAFKKAKPGTSNRPSKQPSKKQIIKISLLSSLSTFMVVLFIFSGYHLYKQLFSTQDSTRQRPAALYDGSPPDISDLLAANLEIPTNRPFGKIFGPTPYEMVQRQFSISAITRNIPEDRHIVITVDHEGLRLCWPKKIHIDTNTLFRTDIIEGGPIGVFTVGIYAVDDEHYEKIKAWFDNGIFGGLPILPTRFKLDSVELSISAA